MRPPQVVYFKTIIVFGVTNDRSNILERFISDPAVDRFLDELVGGNISHNFHTFCVSVDQILDRAFGF